MSETAAWSLRAAAAALLAFSLAACAMVAGVVDMEGCVGADGSANVPMILDGDQILFEFEAQRPNGSWRSGLALLNMGQSPPILKQNLYDELAIGAGRPLRLRIGARRMAIAAGAVRNEPDRPIGERQFGSFFPSRRVDMVLQSGALAAGELVIDYPARRLAFTAPGAAPHEGVAVPIRIDRRSGLAIVDATIDGKSHAFVIDAGSPYSWMRGALAAQWLERHPDWLRGHGAFGPANYNMLDLPFEKDGDVLRVPQIALGALEMKDVGLMGSGPSLGPADGLIGEAFWNVWQEQAGETVAGWLGADVLKRYRLTIDYPNAISYWRKGAEPDAREFDRVGVTLVYERGDYFIGGIIARAGRASVDGLEIGDLLVAIDGEPTHGAPRERVLTALRGAPGARKILRVARGSAELDVAAEIAAF
ncbi:peptide-binding protein [Methylosinus sp. H3A]|uniref:peptide-binding protein n=1 Tax=Methylosinus sp. H3A TaxID=2785786 RepID=UPI0018C22203|nr:peptide-binding protein [Methylosinus sp. H3A]MBG0810467.1 peptide-binding protein [Methylosinus sp. H3A]